MDKIKNLLLWCKKHTDGYNKVSISNFTSSWKDGLAFCALLHRFKPDLINFHDLDPVNLYYNNYLAFNVAENNFGIPSLLDPKDMEHPERLSIITYVSQYYNCLKNMEPEGSPDENRFQHSTTENYHFERISARASVARLSNLKCSNCGDKVYILERYVAGDKLYHRRCYRRLQLDQITDCRVAGGSELVIQDELRLSGGDLGSLGLNKGGMFVHPLNLQQPTPSHGDGSLELKTNEPVYVAVDDDESASESLESFSVSSRSASSSSEDLKDSLPVVSQSLVSDDTLEVFEKKEEITETKEEEIVQEFQEESSEVMDDEDSEDVNDGELPCQENLVQNLPKATTMKPVRSRLYIKKRDKELPYSTCFELSPRCPRQFHEQIPDDEPVFEPVNCVIQEKSEETSGEAEKISDTTDSPVVPMRRRHSPLQPVFVDFTDPIESDSDSISSLESMPHATALKLGIVRHSVWRRPIICGATSRQHRRSVSLSSNTSNDTNKSRDFSHFKKRLRVLNSQQSQIETRARHVQERLWEEDPASPGYDSLLTEWLNMVEEKDKLFYEENSLYAWIQDLRLQEEKEIIEEQIRQIEAAKGKDCKMSPEQQQLVRRLVETVNKRSLLVDEVHEENQRRLEMSKIRNDQRPRPKSHKQCLSGETCNPKLPPSQAPLKHKFRFWKPK